MSFAAEDRNNMKYLFTIASLSIFGIGCSTTDDIEEAQAQADSVIAMDSPTAEVARAAMAHPNCSCGTERWGRFDQAGQSNTQTRRKMLEATALIGPASKQIALGHGYDESMPTFHSPGLTG